jgi:hypothetical protein
MTLPVSRYASFAEALKRFEHNHASALQGVTRLIWT